MFVTATVEEVVHTLVIAFVLVAIVVFLFLGRLRTTLIPLLAVPVSIVGTFAVMLAMGYTANTVSLLALVRRHRHRRRRRDRGHRERRAGDRGAARPVDSRGHQARDVGDHRAGDRHHARPAVGVRAGGLHSRPERPAVPPVRGRGLDLHGDLGDQRADAVARAVLGAAEARRRASAGSCATCWAPSTRAATATPPSCAGWCALVGGRHRCRAAHRRRRPSASTGSRRRASCRRRTRAASSPPCACRKAPRSTAPRRSSPRSRTSCGRSPACRACCRWSG